jgi:hypothetical protein
VFLFSSRKKYFFLLVLERKVSLSRTMSKSCIGMTDTNKSKKNWKPTIAAWTGSIFGIVILSCGMVILVDLIFGTHSSAKVILRQERLCFQGDAVACGLLGNKHSMNVHYPIRSGGRTHEGIWKPDWLNEMRARHAYVRSCELGVPESCGLAAKLFLTSTASRNENQAIQLYRQGCFLPSRKRLTLGPSQSMQCLLGARIYAQQNNVTETELLAERSCLINERNCKIVVQDAKEGKLGNVNQGFILKMERLLAAAVPPPKEPFDLRSNPR